MQRHTAGTARKGLSGNKAARGIFRGQTEIMNSSLGRVQTGTKVKKRGLCESQKGRSKARGCTPVQRDTALPTWVYTWSVPKTQAPAEQEETEHLVPALIPAEWARHLESLFRLPTMEVQWFGELPAHRSNGFQYFRLRPRTHQNDNGYSQL